MSAATPARISIMPEPIRVRVRIDGRELAASRRARVLRETGYPDRYYIPASDVALAALAPSSTRTHCPFKGDAAYYAWPRADGTSIDVAWCYPEPLADLDTIAGHLAFDPAVATIIID